MRSVARPAWSTQTITGLDSDLRAPHAAFVSEEAIGEFSGLGSPEASNPGI